MKNCIFCKIIKGEIPSYKIYEDKDVYAFLDIAGDYEGHTLVVPKKHCTNVLNACSKTSLACLKACKKIANHYKTCGYDGANIFTNAEPCAEQSVMHMHFHIMPRKNGDGLKLCPGREDQHYNLDKLCDKLKLK